MNCPYCGAEMRDIDTNCRQCGRAVVPPVVPPLPVFPQYQQPQYPVAPYGARFGAWLLDAVFAGLLAIPGVVIFFIIFWSTFRGLENGSGESPEAFPYFFGTFLIVYFLALIPSIYYSFCKDGFKGGASWGKRICGLRVVHLDTNQRCTKGRSLLRQVIYLLNVYGVLTLVDIIMVFANSRRRRLGDYVAGTMVIPAEVTFAPQAYPAWPGQQQWAPPGHYSQPPPVYPQQPPTVSPGGPPDRPPPLQR